MIIKIISYCKEYHDSMIDCLVCAKEALNRQPRINEDLFDINKNYFDNGDLFLLAIDESGKVVGMIGTKTESTILWLKRFYVRPEFKRNRIGTKLFNRIVEFALEKRVNLINLRISIDYIEGYNFYLSKGFYQTDEIEGIKYLSLSI